MPRAFATICQEDKVEWGVAHAFYTNMSGILGVSEDELQDEESQVSERRTDPVDCLLVTSIGYGAGFEDQDNYLNQRKDPWDPKLIREGQN